MSAGYFKSINVTGLPSLVLAGAGNSSTPAQTLSAANNNIINGVLVPQASSTKGTNMLLGATGSPVVTIPISGAYAIKFQVLLSMTAAGMLGCFIIGGDGTYYALNYNYLPVAGGSTWVECTGVEYLATGTVLTPGVYTSSTGSVAATSNQLNRFTVTCINTAV
jgi:hypothetical protein